MPRHVEPHDERQAAFLREIVESPQAQQGADVIEDTIENLKEILESRWKNGSSQAEAGTGTAADRTKAQGSVSLQSAPLQ